MDKNKLVLPIAILLGCIILGGFYYASETNKQQSIERQQQIDLQAKQTELKAKTKADEKQQQIELQAKEETDRVKAEREKVDAVFSNNLKCQTLLKDLKQRWNNVVGIYYSDLQNTCIVKFTANGKTEEAPVEDMQDE